MTVHNVYLLFHVTRMPASQLSTLFLTSVSIYRDRVVLSKVLDSDPDGEYLPRSNHNAVLRKFVSSHFAVSHFRMHIDNIITPLLCTSHYSGTS